MAGGGFARLTERAEGFQQLADALLPRRFELTGKLGSRDGGGLRRQRGAHGAGLFGERLGPRGAFGFGGASGDGGFGSEGGLRRALRVLEVWAQIADLSAPFFVGALAVQGDEAFEDRFVGKRGGPAVSGE